MESADRNLKIPRGRRHLPRTKTRTVAAFPRPAINIPSMMAGYTKSNKFSLSNTIWEKPGSKN
jgi:hypothetical protein